MSEFCELLISKVKSTRVLWDTKHKDYHNRLMIDREWSRIAADLEESKHLVKNKWKNLRDKFKKELNKIPKCQSGEDGENASRYNGTWCHFESMLFLKSILTSRVTEGNITDTQADISQCLGPISGDEHSQSGISFPTPSIKGVTRVPSQQQRDSNDLEKMLPSKNTQKTSIVIQRKRRESARKEFLQLVLAKKVASLEKNDEDDEDINFFKSLLPHVKQLPPLSKLSFRSQVQNLLADEIRKLPNNRHPDNLLAAPHHQRLHISVPSPDASTTSTCVSASISSADNLQASISGYHSAS